MQSSSLRQWQVKPTKLRGLKMTYCSPPQRTNCATMKSKCNMLKRFCFLIIHLFHYVGFINHNQRTPSTDSTSTRGWSTTSKKESQPLTTTASTEERQTNDFINYFAFEETQVKESHTRGPLGLLTKNLENSTQFDLLIDN